MNTPQNATTITYEGYTLTLTEDGRLLVQHKDRQTQATLPPEAVAALYRVFQNLRDDRVPFAKPGLVDATNDMQRSAGGLNATSLFQDPPEQLTWVQQAAEHFDHALWITVQDLRSGTTTVMFANRAYEVLLNQSHEQLYAASDSYLQAIHSEDRPLLSRWQHQRTPRTLQQLCRLQRPDGQIEQVEARQITIPDDHSERIFRVMLLRKPDANAGARPIASQPVVAGAVAQRAAAANAAADKSELAVEFRQALLLNELQLSYQPIFDLSNRRLFGVEALLRWDHPTRGLLTPSNFLDSIEEAKMGLSLDSWVLRRALAERSAWISDDAVVALNINVTVQALQDNRFVHEVSDLLKDHPDVLLIFEINERAVKRMSSELLPALNRLRTYGVRIALDNIGGPQSTLSSLRYLNTLPIDVLKLDRRFTERLTDGSYSQMLQTLVRVGRRRNLPLIATGISNKDWIAVLNEIGCLYGQGNAICMPIPVTQLNALAGRPDAALVQTDPEPVPFFPPARVPEVPPPLVVGPSAKSERPSLQPAPVPFPETLSDSNAVMLAYEETIVQLADYLTHNLSVLVSCDKVLAQHLSTHAMHLANKEMLLVDGTENLNENVDLRDTQGSRLLGNLLLQATPEQVLVLHHLDLIVDNRAEWPLLDSARILAALFYRRQSNEPTLLAFADPSLHIPKVVRDRFNIHLELNGIRYERLSYLVTAEERDCFATFDQVQLYKQVAGMHVVQLRRAMHYLCQKHTPGTSDHLLLRDIRPFQRELQQQVDIPDVTFDEIGGYSDVKAQVFEAIELITGQPVPYSLDGKVEEVDEAPVYSSPVEDDYAWRMQLAPRGFLFFGPPGTGKTLFAKAIANAMRATIHIVSGPEIVSMWLGQSESNLRRLFSAARSNAPAVLLFDELDSLVSRRTSYGDSGSRSLNSVVSQMLTELDGFRADEGLLVIGTTNRLDMIDPALLRPSRLLPIAVDLPDGDARRQIAGIHAQSFGLEIAESELLDLLVEQTIGFNGDEIRAIFQGIARRTRRGEPLDRETFITQIERARRRHREAAPINLEGGELWD